jgi:hypothetical protein
MTLPSFDDPKRAAGSTEALDSILVVVEGPGDKTRRRRRPNIPLEPPPRAPRSDNAGEDQLPPK